MVDNREEAAPEAEARFRHYTGWMDKLVKGVSIFLILFTIVFVLGILDRVGLWLVTPRLSAVHLGSVLFLGFLLLPATKGAPRDRLPWYDACLALLAIPWNVYVFFWYGTVEMQILQAYTPLWNEIFIWLTVALCLEAGRRTVGPYFLIVVVSFLIYALYADHFPMFLRAAPSSPGELARHIGLWDEGLLGPLVGISATIIVSFILFGNILEATGGGKAFIGAALALFGHVRGGPAKVAVVASAGFGMMAGSMIANVATTGSVTIPLMKRTGYRPEFAGAVEAAASTGGHVTPPVMGAAIFVMCEFLGIPYWQACVSAAVPAALYYISLFVMVDLEAARTGLGGVPRSKLPSLKKALAGSWIYLVPLVILVFMLFVLMWSPQTSALYSILAFLLLLLLIRREQLSVKNILRSISGTIGALITVAPLLALAGVIRGCFEATGLGFRLTGGLIDIAGGNVIVLVALAALFTAMMGFAVPMFAVYITVAILVAPALMELGIVPIAAHLFIIWYAIAGTLTPPVCTMAYVAAAIAGSHPFRTGLIAARLGIVAFTAPVLFIFSPQLLLIGTAGDVILAVGTAAIGVAALATGFAGYLLTNLNWLQRILFIVGGGMLYLTGPMTDGIGILTLAIAILLHLRARRMSQLKAVDIALGM